MIEIPDNVDREQFQRWYNAANICVFKAAQMLDPTLTPEKFFPRIGAIIEGVVSQVMFVDEEMDWLVKREEIKKFTINLPENE